MKPNIGPTKRTDDASELGRLIRLANATYETPVNELDAWQKFEYRFETQNDRKWRTLSFLAVPVAIAACFFVYLKTRTTPPPVALEADRAVVAVTRAVPSVAVIPQPYPVLPTSLASSSRVVATLTPTAPNRNIDCALAERKGPTKDFALCLERRSQGTSLDAERALYELARLKQGALRDPAGAVTILKTYRQRYPQGALRGEVDFALVELLPKVGQAVEALVESERLLGTAWGRARSSELKLVRGRIEQDKLGDCEKTLNELNPIKNEFGPIGNEATLRTAECFERTGDNSSAITTYRDYLMRSGI